MVGVRVLAPAPYGFREVDSILPAACISPPLAVKRMDFAFVVYPSTASAWAGKPEFTLASQTLSATVVHVSGSVAFDHVIRHSGAADTVAVGGYVCNGKAASIGKNTNGRIVDLFLTDGALISDSSGGRILLQSGGSVNGVHVALGDTAIMVYLDQKGGPSLRIFAPGANPALVKVPGWSVTVTVDGDYLLINGPAPAVKQKIVKRSLIADAIIFVNRGRTIRVLTTQSGTMIASAFRLDGKCVWRSAPCPVKSRSITDIPCDLERMQNLVLVVRVDINGTTSAQSLIRLVE